jgi:hypothetical protein
LPDAAVPDHIRASPSREQTADVSFRNATETEFQNFLAGQVTGQVKGVAERTDALY